MNIDPKILKKIIHYRIQNKSEFYEIHYWEAREKQMEAIESNWKIALPINIDRIIRKKIEVEISKHSLNKKTGGIEVLFTSTLQDLDKDRDFRTSGSMIIEPEIYLQWNRESILSGMEITIEGKIKSGLDKYLEFDSDEIFAVDYNLIRVFGGAIRDIIAEEPINDVDILCGSKAAPYLESLLERFGYTYQEYLSPKDLQSMYCDIHIINEPRTWIKDSKIVQVIRPVIGPQNLEPDLYKSSFNRLISEVDLTPCGISWDGHKLYEDCKSAINHCQNRVFAVNEGAEMWSEKRIYKRVEKLLKRGWKEIPFDSSVNRDLKLLNVLDE